MQKVDELTEGRGGGHDGASRQSMKKRKEIELIFSHQNHVRLLQNAQNSDDDDGSEKKISTIPTDNKLDSSRSISDHNEMAR